MEINTLIEVVSVVFGLLFLILLMIENIWCWLFGILSSALSIYLFIEAKLYSESILYFFYVLVGIYGWVKWGSGSKGIDIKKWPFKKSLPVFIVGLTGAIGLGWFFSNHTDAANPTVDAATTSFSFVASFLEAHKVLSAWVYWIVINGVSIWLYLDRGLEVYSGLMVVYFLLSIYGLYQWNKKFNAMAL